jgi:cytochrome c oxidase subunit 1
MAAPNEIGTTPPAAESYLSARGARSWLGSLDHKRIAVLHLGTLAVLFALGAAYALALGLARLRPGALVDVGTHRSLLASHGVVMIFLVVLPAIPATLGTFVLPLMLGARNVAFPRLARAALRLTWLGSALALGGLMTAELRSGWTFAGAWDASASGTGALVAMLGVLLVAVAGMFGGINTIVSLHKLRTTGLSWERLPLFAWAGYAASVIALLAPAPLAAALTLATAERALHIGVFDPRLGGDPLMFQHLFWFSAHPSLVGAMIWALGVGSELLGVHAQRRLFGHRVLAAAFFVLAALSFTQWSIHLAGAGAGELAAAVSSALTMAALVPVILVLGNWLSTLRGGSIALDAPMIFALALIVNLTVWLGASVAASRLDLLAYLRRSSFEVAQLHYGLAGGTLTAFLGGLFHWWPKLAGRTYAERPAKLAAVGVFAGLALTHAGKLFATFQADPQVTVHAAVSMVGTWVLVGSVFLALGTLVASVLRAPRCAPNPWGGASLEWETASPPLADNFAERPEVTHDPYDFVPHAT